MSELFKFGEMPLSASIYTATGVEELVNNAVVGGVTKLLKFVGISSTDPLTVGATVEGISTFTEGNVVLWKPEGYSEYSEYVYVTVDGALKWERLGDASRIGQLEAEVANKADASALNAVDGRLTTAEGEIDALQADIATKAASADLTALAGRVTTAEGEIDALQADIAKKADASALTDGLALKADVTALTAVDGRLATAEGEIDALQAAIATKAESSVVEGIGGRVTTAEGEIDALQAAIATKAEAADVVSKDKLLVLSGEDEFQYYTGSHGIYLQEEEGGPDVTITPSMGIFGNDGQGGNWGVESTGLYIGNGTVTTRVDIAGVDINDGEKSINFSVSTISVSDTDGNYYEVTYPSAAGQLATVEAMAGKYDGAVGAVETIHGAAGTATTALAGVTNVNELIAVLNTFFGTVGA